MARVGLSEVEQLILAALAIVRKGVSGMALQEHAEKLINCRRTVSSGALYSALGRLEVKGHVRSRISESADDRDHRSKQYFEITTSGHVALRDTLRIASSMIAELRRSGWHWIDTAEEPAPAPVNRGLILTGQSSGPSEDLPE